MLFVVDLLLYKGGIQLVKTSQRTSFPDVSVSRTIEVSKNPPYLRCIRVQKCASNAFSCFGSVQMCSTVRVIALRWKIFVCAVSISR